MADESPAQFLGRRAFLKEASRRAESLFSYIDKRIRPQLFLVEISPDEACAMRAEVVAPENFWISSGDFSDMASVAAKIAAEAQSQKRRAAPSQDVLSATFHGARDVVSRIVTSCPKRPADTAFFVSDPATLGDTDVFIVFGIEHDILEKYPSLDLPSDADLGLSPSFMVSLIEEFLEKHRIELDMPVSPSESGGFHFGLDSIIRQAGRNFVGDIAYRVSGKPQPLWHEHIFSVCTEISRTHYELAEASGAILLAPAGLDYLASSVRFSANPRLGDVRSTRKLLELTKDGLVLHSDSETIFGLCRPPRRLPKSANCFFIEFLGRHRWQISYSGKPLIVVSYGVPMPPSSSFEAREFANSLKKVFGFKAPRKIDRLVELIQTATREKKGTMLVFSKSARDEAKRLAPQSTPIAPMPLTKQILSSLTPIDGAILIDHNGVCHSIGTILDGIVTSSGDSSRGARYNSAVKYIESRKAAGETCMAITVSEDGIVDIVT